MEGKRTANPSPIAEQLDKLAEYPAEFRHSLADAGIAVELPALSATTLQINAGKLCNQACRHCHVDASPKRTEIMTKATFDRLLEIIDQNPEFRTVDITGGAAEMNPHFRWFVESVANRGLHIIDRCNLTILSEPGFEWVAAFLYEHKVEVIASLPHYARQRTDSQRGQGVFDRSVSGLKLLNSLGYGTDLPLNLVYNPSGLFLSQPQAVLEREFKSKLAELGIIFNNLYCINNMPINRFLDSLLRAGKYEEYMNMLVTAFNPATVEGLMCRHQISVGYEGSVYDCDFNQMLELKSEKVSHIDNFNMKDFLSRKIVTANHCYGCTAGAGSSCGGELASAV